MEFLRIEDAILQAGIREGEKVLDVGTGAGHALPLLSRLVGETGRVYAFDVQKELLTRAKTTIEKERLNNVDVLWGDVERTGGIKLNDASIDTALIINALFQFEDRGAALKEVRRVLVPRGKLFLVDWHDAYGGIGPAQDAVVAERDAEKLLIDAGFQKEKLFQPGPHHYGIVVRNS